MKTKKTSKDTVGSSDKKESFKEIRLKMDINYHDEILAINKFNLKSTAASTVTTVSQSSSLSKDDHEKAKSNQHTKNMNIGDSHESSDESQPVDEMNKSKKQKDLNEDYDMQLVSMDISFENELPNISMNNIYPPCSPSDKDEETNPIKSSSPDSRSQCKESLSAEDLTPPYERTSASSPQPTDDSLSSEKSEDINSSYQIPDKIEVTPRSD